MQEDVVSKLVAKLGSQVDYQVIAGADHYYRGLEEEMGTVVNEYVARRLQEFQLKRKVRPDRKRRQLPRD